MVESFIKRNIFFLLMIIPLVNGKEAVNESRTKSQVLGNRQVFLFVHGAWGGGWEYSEVDSILTEKGHAVYHPTLTGLGERSHLADESINLTTHINDVVNVIKFENLDQIILIGHSYGGMVISGVAEQVPSRIKHLIYVDAFVPKDQESIKSIVGDEAWKGLTATRMKDGFILYPFGETKSVPPTDVPQPLATFTESLTIINPLVEKIPTAYILMTRNGNANFESGAQRGRERGWRIYEIEGDHYPMRNQPDILVEKIEFILQNGLN